MGSKEANKTPHKPRNYVLGGSGIMRYSRSRMYSKKAMYRLSKKVGIPVILK